MTENMYMKWIYLAVQHHIGPAVHTSFLRFNRFKLNMLLANQSDLMAHLIPHTGGDGQGVVPTQEELAQGMRKSSKHRR